MRDIREENCGHGVVGRARHPAAPRRRGGELRVAHRQRPLSPTLHYGERESRPAPCAVVPDALQHDNDAALLRDLRAAPAAPCPCSTARNPLPLRAPAAPLCPTARRSRVCGAPPKRCAAHGMTVLVVAAQATRAPITLPMRRVDRLPLDNGWAARHNTCRRRYRLMGGGAQAGSLSCLREAHLVARAGRHAPIPAVMGQYP